MNTENDRLTAIRKCLMETFEPHSLDIEDHSHLHYGHSGNNGGGHYVVKIISSHFEGHSEIARHRMVYKALEALMPEAIHAISIKTDVPPAE